MDDDEVYSLWNSDNPECSGESGLCHLDHFVNKGFQNHLDQPSRTTAIWSNTDYFDMCITLSEMGCGSDGDLWHCLSATSIECIDDGVVSVVIDYFAGSGYSVMPGVTVVADFTTSGGGGYGGNSTPCIHIIGDYGNVEFEEDNNPCNGISVYQYPELLQ